MSSTTQVSSLIGLIYDAAVDADAWPQFLEAFAVAINAGCAALLHHDLRKPRGNITASFRLAPESQRQYAEHFGTIDPWVKGAESRRLLLPGVVHIGEELIAHDDLVRTEYDNDLAKPF
jgi:hypothetical protein